MERGRFDRDGEESGLGGDKGTGMHYIVLLIL